MTMRQTFSAVARIYLSAPEVGSDERILLMDALDSNWIAPLGPHVDAFERELAALVGVRHAVAMSSGTAALHLAFLLAGVGPGDDVLVPTLTFVATANAVLYTGARPVLIDSESSTWNVDPDLVAEELALRKRRGARAAAVVAVDLYGQCCDYARLRSVCDQYQVPLIEDSAEALGATFCGRQAGSLGDIGIFSFNGNKIITTSGGGMLVTDNEQVATRARHLASQAREPVKHYEHLEIGYNYRLSNLLAAVGRAQLRKLDRKIGRRREIYLQYRRALADMPGLSFMPEVSFGQSNHWLTVVTVDPLRFGADRDDVIACCEESDIEARPAWKPLHRQPLFRGSRVVGGSVAEGIFSSGICLPSGSALSDADIERVIEVLRGSSPRRGG